MWSVTIQCCGCYSKVDLSVHCLILHLIQSRQRFHMVSGMGESGFFTRACSWPHKHSGCHKTNSVPNLMVHFSSCTMSFWRVDAYLLLLGFLRLWASLAQPQVISRPRGYQFLLYKTIKQWDICQKRLHYILIVVRGLWQIILPQLNFQTTNQGLKKLRACLLYQMYMCFILARHKTWNFCSHSHRAVPEPSHTSMTFFLITLVDKHWMSTGAQFQNLKTSTRLHLGRAALYTAIYTGNTYPAD